METPGRPAHDGGWFVPARDGEARQGPAGKRQARRRVMRNGRISPHEVRLLLALRREPVRWHTNRALADSAEVSERTARAHTARLAKIGVVEVERVFPGNRCRLVTQPAEEAKDYLVRVDKAREVFGL
jgi:hypothetical protein